MSVQVYINGARFIRGKGNRQVAAAALPVILVVLDTAELSKMIYHAVLEAHLVSLSCDSSGRTAFGSDMRTIALIRGICVCGDFTRCVGIVKPIVNSELVRQNIYVHDKPRCTTISVVHICARTVSIWLAAAPSRYASSVLPRVHRVQI